MAARYFLLSLLMFLVACQSQAMAAKARVIKVIDGDSLKVELANGKKVQFRLYGIDTPEYNQRHSKDGKNYLKKTVLGKTVSYSAVTTDRYGRIVALVKKGSISINEMLVKKGYAWVYPRYCKKKICKKWENLQNRAQSRKYGLWADKDPVSPWDWKHK